MKVKYDREIDVLYLAFNDHKVHESDESRNGVIIDYDKDGGITGIEIIDASKNMPSPIKIEYEVAE